MKSVTDDVTEDVPEALATDTATVPVPDGEIAAIFVSLTTVNLDAFAFPKKTPVAPVNPLPVMVTWVPPFALPFDGLTPSTTGE